MYLPVMYLPFYIKRYDSVLLDNTQNVDEEGNVGKPQAWRQLTQRFAQRYNLSIWLSLILPLYTVNYLIALFGGFNAAQTIAVYQVLSVFTKGIFAAATMDIHLDALHMAQRELLVEQRENEARRAFLKHIFHEVHSHLYIYVILLHLLDDFVGTDAVEFVDHGYRSAGV